MGPEGAGTIWLLYQDELIREDCVRRFEKAGVEIRPVRWDGHLLDMIVGLHRDDWVILDYQELQRMGPRFGEAFKDLLQMARVMVISAEEVDARELYPGWVELAKPIHCATICAVVESLTGTRGCLEPGCCGHLGSGHQE